MALPFLVLLVIAVVEMGVLFSSYVSLVNAAREGAIFAAKCPIMYNSSNDSDASCTNTQNNPNPIPNINWYRDRVAGDIVVGDSTGVGTPGSQFTIGQIQNQPVECNDPANLNGYTLGLYHLCLAADRPVIGPAGGSCPTGLEIGCPITTTVHYRIYTFTSTISFPYYGRFGLPNYYQLDYSVAMPIQ